VPAAAVHDSYADLGAGGFEVHNDGEVWAATLWDLRTQLGATITDRIVLNGMKFTPTRPSFLNARDGIIQADQNLNGGANRCAIWTVFARHGMGVSAVGNDGTTHVAATDVPADCGNPGGCTNTIVNPGFETGTTPWTISGQVTRSTGSFPHSGTAYMILNGVNSTTGTLFQTVTVPTNGCTNLSFWLNITTNEAAGASVFDRLFIEVRSTGGTLLATLATFSNQNSGTAGVYVLRGPFNLSSFAGQTVRIQFRGTNDVTLPTIFRVDDVSLQ